MISKVCMSQDFVFNQSKQRMDVPAIKHGIQWEIGSSSLRVILQSDDQKTDTIFNSIGCSQYHLEITEEYTDLKIYLWPLYQYNADCALEEEKRPLKEDGDLLVHYFFRDNSITAEVKWNFEKYSNDSIYSSIAFDSFDYDFLASVFSLIQQGKTVSEIIDSLLIENRRRQSNDMGIMYRNDVLINLLPLNNRTLSSLDIYVLRDCFEMIHKKYTR